MDCKGAALADRAFDGDIAAVGLSDVLDNGKPQSRAAQLTASGFVHPVKAFKQSGQMFLGNTDALIPDIDLDF